MLIEKIIHTIDTHTAGESTRVVIHGYPALPRTDPQTLRELLAREHDRLRRMLMWEPRGHLDMFGALLLPPSQPDTHMAAVFMHSAGYLPMCVHGLIGVVLAAVETGHISEGLAGSLLKVETPAGVVEVCFRRNPKTGFEVTVRSAPCFVMESGLEIDLGSRPVCADIVFGGSIFALVRAADVGLKVEPRYATDLQRVGLAIRAAVNQKRKFTHPHKPRIAGVELVEISDEARNPLADARNAVVFGQGQLDRSPCGTGTCAKMALLYTQGELRLGQEFVHEGILGTLFHGRLVAEQRLDSYRAVVPEITGTAFVTGIQQFVIDSLDPLRDGFLLAGECDPSPERIDADS